MAIGPALATVGGAVATGAKAVGSAMTSPYGVGAGLGLVAGQGPAALVPGVAKANAGAIGMGPPTATPPGVANSLNQMAPTVPPTAPPTPSLAPTDVSTAFQPSSAQVVWDAIKIPLMISPETARVVGGIEGLVGSINERTQMPLVMDALTQLTQGKITPQVAMNKAVKAGVSFDTFGKYLGAFKGLDDLTTVKADAAKKVLGLVNDKMTAMEKAQKSGSKTAQAEVAAVTGYPASDVATPTSAGKENFLNTFKQYIKNPETDYKEFLDIYTPLAKRQQDPLEQKLERLLNPGQPPVDPYAAAVALYADRIGAPNPMQPQGAQEPAPTPPQLPAAPTAPPAAPMGKIAQESQMYADQLQQKVQAGAISQEEAAMLFNAKYGKKK